MNIIVDIISDIDEKDYCFLFQYFRVLLRNQTQFLLGMFRNKSGWFKVLGLAVKGTIYKFCFSL